MDTRKQRNIFVANMIEELSIIQLDLQTSDWYTNFDFKSYADNVYDMNCQTLNICVEYFITENEASIMTDFIIDIYDEIKNWITYDHIIYRDKLQPIINKFTEYLYKVIADTDYPY